VKSADGDIAVFRNAEDEVFALRDKCPTRAGRYPGHRVRPARRLPAAQLDHRPRGRQRGAPDKGCAGRYAVRVEDGIVYCSCRYSPYGASGRG